MNSANNLHQARSLGQSVWFDYISRSLIDSGELSRLVDAGVGGVTSNPAIFEKAIAGSGDYDGDLSRLAKESLPAPTILERLMVSDVARACDVLADFHEDSNGLDGFVSLEVSPGLAHDSTGTIEAARRIHGAVDRPNLMVKIPATDEGFVAIEEATAVGISVNVTLLFSVSSYERAADAYIRGLERYAETGATRFPSSVASFFVSRIDSAIDAVLPPDDELRGKIAVDNARIAYRTFRRILDSDRWKPLAKRGAPVQRLLWASTGTKNPSYPDTLYVDHLIGPDTVNTVPPDTLTAFLDHGRVERTVERDLEGADRRMELLKSRGISLAEITDKLSTDGVAAFAQAYGNLLQKVEERLATCPLP